MEFVARRVFYSENAWAEAWGSAPEVSPLFQRLGGNVEPPDQTVAQAAFFIAGALEPYGFQLFNNGGLPLLERRNGPWQIEVLLRPGPRAVRGIYVPVSVHLHLSHSGVREVREKFWRPASRAPKVVASCDIGQLEIPPCWVIWNIANGVGEMSTAAQWLKRLALPWLDAFEDSLEMHRRILLGDLPFVDQETGLELMLAEFGLDYASQYLNRALAYDPELGRKVRRRTDQIVRAVVPGGRGTHLAHNLAVIAASYGLL